MVSKTFTWWTNELTRTFGDEWGDNAAALAARLNLIWRPKNNFVVVVDPQGRSVFKSGDPYRLRGVAA